MKDDVKKLTEDLNKKPIISLYLNEQLITNNSYVELMCNQEGNFPIIFRLQNDGSGSAKRVQVNMQFPDILVDITHGNSWINHGKVGKFKYPSVSKDSSVDLVQFTFISSTDIHPKNWLTLGSFYTKGASSGNGAVLFKIRLSYENISEIVFNLTLLMSR